MRVVEKPTQHNRRTGYDSLPLYIGIFRDNLEFPSGLFQKKLAVPVCHRDSLGDSIRPASHPSTASRRGTQPSRSELLPLLLPFQVPARSFLQSSSASDHPDLSTEKASYCRRRYTLPKMGQAYFRRLFLLGSHQPAATRLHLGTRLGRSGRRHRTVRSARRFAFLDFSLPLQKALSQSRISYSAPDHNR